MEQEDQVVFVRSRVKGQSHATLDMFQVADDRNNKKWVKVNLGQNGRLQADYFGRHNFKSRT